MLPKRKFLSLKEKLSKLKEPEEVKEEIKKEVKKVVEKIKGIKNK